jgi:hypothetical protein
MRRCGHERLLEGPEAEGADGGGPGNTAGGDRALVWGVVGDHRTLRQAP